MGSRVRTALTEFHKQNKMGVFADLQPKLNIDLLQQIQRHKLDFSGRPASPATASVSPTRKMQIACETPELQEMYEWEATHAARSGVDLFFKKDMVIPSGRSFMIPLGITCRLVPSQRPFIACAHAVDAGSQA